MSKEDYIPQYLDEPERYIVFTPDEAIAAIVPLAVLSALANFAIGLVGAAAAVLALRKFKEGGPLHRLLWRAYWLAPPGVLKTKATPPSHLRQLAG
jgi:conjugal transfer pilus assembly protein TraL